MLFWVQSILLVGVVSTLLDGVNVPLHLLVHLPADNGLALSSKDLGEFFIRENDPAIRGVLELVPFDVGPDILADVSPGEAFGSNNGRQGSIHFHQDGGEGISSWFLDLPGSAHPWIFKDFFSDEINFRSLFLIRLDGSVLFSRINDWLPVPNF